MKSYDFGFQFPQMDSFFRLWLMVSYHAVYHVIVMVFQLSPFKVSLSTFALKGLLYFPFDIRIPPHDFIRVVSCIFLSFSLLFLDDFPK